MIKNLNKIIQDGVDRGLLQKFTSGTYLDSANVSIDNTDYVNFGSCSYLGLEYHPLIKQGVKDAVDAYGTQFSTSRTYLSIGLYKELETELSNMFGKPVIASASTTLGHLAALPVLVEEGDVVILDLQVHSSVQMAAKILKANKIQVHLIPHNDMNSLESKIKLLSEKANRIWYMADGVYSMYGDYAPLHRIDQLLNTYKKFHLYIDDAHGMGWTGEHGIGYVRSQMEHHDKMVLATSLNKSFAASGGLLVFPNQKMYQKVKNCGTTLIFSGPIQPPMLGAGIASAKLHQTAGFKEFQNSLQEKINFTNRRLNELDLPQYKITDSPLFFIPVGLPRTIITIIKRMKRKGFYLNSAGFPATPMKKGGIRFMINDNLTIEQIDAMLTNLQKEYVLGLLSDSSSPEAVAKQFKLSPFLTKHQFLSEKHEMKMHLVDQHYNSIAEIDPEEWNALFYKFGSNEYDNLKGLEAVFRDNEAVENNWQINYHIVRDKNGNIILASVYSLSIMMDDLLASKEVSAKIKEIRKVNKFYLTSKTVMSGTPFTKGRSIFVDYAHDDWKEAVKIHVDFLQELAENKEASKIILREFCVSQKDRLEPLLLELGLLELELPNNCVVNNMTWDDTEDLLKRLPQKYRYSLRKEILKKEDLFKVSYERPTTEIDQRHVFELYRKVYKQSTEISVFELPFSLFQKMFNDPSYDFIHVYLKNGPEHAVAVMISQVIGTVYYAQLVGLDYDYVRKNGTYKQILYQTAKRAKQLGCEKVDMAYTAEMEKKKVGAIPEKTYGFVMALEHSSYAEMELLK
ncbi:aminotransferase class I/II-fold pyridoxal phosphate-dependent enzyme [Mariniflexile sp. HMF6888]|uniref:aminotransferase class I/II-fold pyridoxal phosphate-dependent enzyme n=1 Tax=Mariniflexile sp. HMF6888 TaxID=3373086 RepID=UPI0037A4DC6C